MDAGWKKTRQPFHETIVNVLRNSYSALELVTLGELLLATKIPQNHDEIIRAWREAVRRNESLLGTNLQKLVVEGLLSQKQETEEGTKAIGEEAACY